MTQDLRRKQVEEIVYSIPDHEHPTSIDKKAVEALLSPLSDAERKGAWAVVRKVEEDSADYSKGRGAGCWEERCKDGSCNLCVIKRCKDAARQAAESFGPDPEGEKV